MRYEVRKWKHGWGIWRVWRFFAWRCRDVGPFGWDMPWTVESLAHDKCASLYNAWAVPRRGNEGVTTCE